MMRPKLIASLLLLLPVCGFAAVEGFSTQFDEANRLYEVGRYRESAEAYSAIIRSGHTSGAVYFNLGNAYLKLDQVGRAIAAYHHARLLEPRDPEIRRNLRHALARLPESEAKPLRALAPSHLGLTATHWTILGTIAIWAFFGLLAIREWKPDAAPRLRRAMYVCGAVALLLALIVASAVIPRIGNELGIITASKASVRYGPLTESEARYTLNDGFVVQILDRKGDWLKITHADRPPGWIQQSNLTKLRDG